MKTYNVWVYDRKERLDLIALGFKFVGRDGDRYTYEISEDEWNRLGKPR